MLFLILGLFAAVDEARDDRVGIFREPDTTSIFGYHVQWPEALTLTSVGTCISSICS